MAQKMDGIDYDSLSEEELQQIINNAEFNEKFDAIKNGPKEYPGTMTIDVFNDLQTDDLRSKYALKTPNPEPHTSGDSWARAASAVVDPLAGTAGMIVNGVGSHLAANPILAAAGTGLAYTFREPIMDKTGKIIDYTSKIPGMLSKGKEWASTYGTQPIGPPRAVTPYSDLDAPRYQYDLLTDVNGFEDPLVAKETKQFQSLSSDASIAEDKWYAKRNEVKQAETQLNRSKSVLQAMPNSPIAKADFDMAEADYKAKKRELNKLDKLSDKLLNNAEDYWENTLHPIEKQLEPNIDPNVKPFGKFNEALRPDYGVSKYNPLGGQGKQILKGLASRELGYLMLGGIPGAIAGLGLEAAYGAGTALSNAVPEQLDALSNAGAGDDTALAAAILNTQKSKGREVQPYTPLTDQAIEQAAYLFGPAWEALQKANKNVDTNKAKRQGAVFTYEDEKRLDSIIKKNYGAGGRR